MKKISFNLEEEKEVGMQLECLEFYQNELLTWMNKCVLAS